jgi:hypothetical protein
MALRNNTSGIYNFAAGKKALIANTTGSSNFAQGYCALTANTTGNANIAIGYYSLTANTGGSHNIALGCLSSYSNQTGSDNIALGYYSLVLNCNGSNNVSIGRCSLYNAKGDTNIAIGLCAGCSITTGTNNTVLGSLPAAAGCVCTLLLGAGTCERLKVDNNGLYINGGSLFTNGSAITLKNTYEIFTALTGATGTVTHDFSTGSIFNHTSIAANFTVNITNLGLSSLAATTITLILNQGATAYIPNALQIAGVSQTINWQGGSAPTGNASKIDIVNFSITNSSGTYAVFGQLTTFG